MIAATPRIRLFMVLLCAFFCLPELWAKSGTTYDYSSGIRATRIWIPDGVTTIRGIFIIGNPAEGDSRGRAVNKYDQAFAAKHDFALMGLLKFYDFDQMSSQEGKNHPDWTVLIAGINDAATRSGHPELNHAPFLPTGFSNGGQFAYGLMHTAPERTIAFCANKGGFYINNGANPPLDVPGILIAGELDTQTRRDNLATVYNTGRSQGAPWAWIQERKLGHEQGNSESLLYPFYDEVIKMRYPSHLAPTATTKPTLLPFDDSNAYLVNESPANWSGGYSEVFPLSGFSGDPLVYGIVPNKKVAELYRAVASYDNNVSTSFSRNQKAVNVDYPSNTISYVAGTNYNAADLTYYQVSVEPSLTNWTQLQIFDGDTLLQTHTNQGSQTIGAHLDLDESLAVNGIHSVLTLDDNSKRTSNIAMYVNNPEDTTLSPGNITCDVVASDGGTSTERTVTFTWDTPTNRSSLGYSYALNEEPDTSSEGSTRSATFADLGDGTYTFRVKSRGNNALWGSSASFTFTVAGPPPLASVANFATTDVASTTVDLQWDATSEPTATHYLIERRLVTASGNEVIIDNDEANASLLEITGSWPQSTSKPGYYGADYAHDNKEAQGTKAFKYLPMLTTRAAYDVYVWYAADANRDNSVPVEIGHVNGTDTVTVNQQTNGNQWNQIGTYELNETSYVEISNTGTTGYVIADGLRLVPSTSWVTLGTVTIGTQTYVDTGLFAESDYEYRIQVVSADNESDFVTLAVTTGTAEAPLAALTSFSATAGSATAVNLSWDATADARANQYIIERREMTSAISHEVIVDNVDAGVTSSGFWNMTWGTGHYANTNPLESHALVGSGRYARFTPDLTGEDGLYDVYLWYADYAACTNVPVTIIEGGVARTVTVDQTQNAGQWFKIGEFNLQEGDYVEISADFAPNPAGSAQRVIADAVRFYRPLSVGAWTVLTTINDTATTSYTDSSVTGEMSYEYRIRVANDTLQSLWATDAVTTPAGGSGATYASWTSSVTWSGKDSTVTADADGDGLVNLQEYAFGSDPVAKEASMIAVSSIEDAGTKYILLDFDRALNTSDIQIVVETSTDLSAWTSFKTYPANVNPSADAQTEILQTTATAQKLRVKIPHTQGEQFVRVRVNTP